MLMFENVVKRFKLDENSSITPVNDVSFNIEKGEMVFILGRSGSGKTTLLNLAAGLVKPTSGRVLFQNHDFKAMSDKQLSLIRATNIGFVFQFPSLLPALNVLENVCLPELFIPRSTKIADQETAMQLLKKLGLGEKARSYPRQLSAGEQKRTVLARALLNRPALILADEPTSDLDEKTENEVMDIIREINAAGITFLIVTHNRNLKRFGDRAFEMENGSLHKVQVHDADFVGKQGVA